MAAQMDVPVPVSSSSYRVRRLAAVGVWQPGWTCPFWCGSTDATSSQLPCSKVPTCTKSSPDESVYQAMRAGASGFMVKNTEPTDLIRTVRVVAKGEALRRLERDQEDDHRTGHPSAEPGVDGQKLSVLTDR